MNPIIKILLCGLLFIARSSLQVNSDFDRSADFGQFRTFTFNENIKYLTLNEVNKRRIVDAITYELELKGLYRQKEAELAVNFFINLQDNSSRPDDKNHAAKPYSYPYMKDFDLEIFDEIDYENGTVFIDIIDLKSRRLIWRGWGIKLLDRNQEIRESRINHIVEKILNHYPPELN